MIDEHDPMEEALNKMFRDDAHRAVNTSLRFWSACLTRRCKRARRCTGDPAICRKIFWPVVREDAKAWWQAIFDARRDGRSLRQAQRLAADAATRQRRIMALRARADMIRDRPEPPDSAR